MENSQLMDYMVTLHFIDFISFLIMDHYTVLHFGIVGAITHHLDKGPWPGMIECLVAGKRSKVRVSLSLGTMRVSSFYSIGHNLELTLLCYKLCQVRH
jgi:hypothetical protein